MSDEEEVARWAESRWGAFGDRELRAIYLALMEAPSSGGLQTHGLMAEIVLAAETRGRSRTRAILETF